VSHLSANNSKKIIQVSRLSANNSKKIIQVSRLSANNSKKIIQVSRGGGDDDAALTLPPAPKSKTSVVSTDENPLTSPESKQEPVPPTK
jgi:hypothetical protein